MTGVSARVHRGLMPSVRKAIPSGSATRFTAAIGVEQADDVVAVEDRLPAGLEAQPVEEGADAGLALVRDRRIAVAVERDLLVFGAEAPFVPRLLAFGDPLDQLVARADGRCIGNVASHAPPRDEAPAGRGTPKCAVDMRV